MSFTSSGVFNLRLEETFSAIYHLFYPVNSKQVLGEKKIPHVFHDDYQKNFRYCLHGLQKLKAYNTLLHKVLEFILHDIAANAHNNQ